MGYHVKRTGKYADTEDINLFPSQTVAVGTTTTAGFEVGDRRLACLTLTSTALGGNLDVTVQTSADNATWRAVASFAQQAAPATERKSFGPFDRFIRLSNVVATGPATFAVTGEFI
jgi:hypothetical protein